MKRKVSYFPLELKVIERIGDIEQCKKEDRVRHLGFFFNQNGLINNLDEILEKILKKLKILRNLYPNFTTRTNIWKGYAISSLMYQSEVIVITKEQVEKFEKIEKWFLFQGNLNDPEVRSIDDLKTISSKISLERLAQPKKYGGMNLRRIEDVFSASKTKVMMRALQDHGKMKPINILLFERSEVHLEDVKETIVHPFYLVESTSRKFNQNWDWYKQASRIFSLIDKDCTTIPEVGDTLLDWHSSEIVYFGDEEDIDRFKFVNKTIPVEISQNSKKRLLEKKENYIQKRKKIDQVVSIGHQRDTPVKTVPQRSKPLNWLKKVKVTFNQMEERKIKKINISNIFKVTIDDDFQPLHTKRQKDWLKMGYDLIGLFSVTLIIISRIIDFRRKFLMSYWRKTEDKCCLCNETFDRMHIFSKCSVVKKWEEEMHANRKNCGDLRKIRIESMFNHKLTSHTWSWIFNWCIWKNYWQVKFQDFDKSDQLESQINNLKEIVKLNEYLHLKYSNATVKQSKIELVAAQTQFFSYFKYSKSHIEEIRREVRNEKTRKNTCFLYMKKRRGNKKNR